MGEDGIGSTPQTPPSVASPVDRRTFWVNLFGGAVGLAAVAKGAFTASGRLFDVFLGLTLVLIAANQLSVPRDAKRARGLVGWAAIAALVLTFTTH